MSSRLHLITNGLLRFVQQSSRLHRFQERAHEWTAVRFRRGDGQRAAQVRQVFAGRC